MILLIFMKLKLAFTTILLMSAIITRSQQPFCADSSIRIKYIFDNNGVYLFGYPDTSGYNIFSGYPTVGATNMIPIMKTTWGDSVLWARKIYTAGKSINTTVAPDGSIIISGILGLGSNLEFILGKLTSNGIVQWLKRYKLSNNHLKYISNDENRKNILVVNNAIYLDANFFTTSMEIMRVIAKIDLSGNTVWSKAFMINPPTNGAITDAPVFYNGKIVFTSKLSQQVGNTFINNAIIITRLNETDGSIMESEAIMPFNNDSLVLGNILTNANSDKSLSLRGILNSSNPGTNYKFFTAQIDSNLNPVNCFYYTNAIALDMQNIYVAFNHQNQHVFLGWESYNPLNKYFVTFGKDGAIQRSRKFVISVINSINGRTSVNLDDKQNLHFVYQYPEGGKTVTEYTRISNFAPSGSLNCFGKDTNVLLRYPLPIVNIPFSWDNVTSDVITSSDLVYTEDTAIVTKQLVCKIVSYCDSVHINGPTTACINQPVRYTVSKNSGCVKNLDWVIDTSFANIINTEGDSAITLNFKKAFTGYIHAALSDCVVNDSFFVTVVPSPVVHFTKRDSLLCPGKTIVLNATPGFAPYQWQDGSTAVSLLVRNPGLYKVSGISYCGIPSSDSILINFSDTSFNLIPSQTKCPYDTAFLILPNDVSNITWQPITSSFLINKTLLVYPTQNTIYTITAERQPGCPITATSAIAIKICPEVIFFPNSFTPNNDGLNDIFKGTTLRPLQSYHFIIYNRYGQAIFETTDQASGWDGTFKGKAQPIGGYTYKCSYLFTRGLQRSEVGYFILIR